jgi:hypothetical protein
VHPRDRELIAGTHGRAVQILDVAPLQQMTADVLAKGTHLFAPTVALQYGERPVGSEPRANRMWRGDRTAAGATITYRLVAAGSPAPRISIVNIAGDTVARVTATNTAGMNTVTWNLMNTGTGPVFAGFGGGGGGRFGGPTGPVNDPGFPAGFNSRPAESRAAPDSSATPTAQERVLTAIANAAANAPAAGPGARAGGAGQGGQGGFGGFGGLRAMPVETGDYRVVLEVGGQTYTQTVRVVRVSPDESSVLVPAKR